MISLNPEFQYFSTTIIIVTITTTKKFKFDNSTNVKMEYWSVIELIGEYFAKIKYSFLKKYYFSFF